MKTVTRLCVAAHAVLFLLLLSPNVSAGPATDKNIEWRSKDIFLDVPHINPFSVQLPTLSSIFSLSNRTITTTFYSNLGAVTFQIVNTETEAVVAEYQTQAQAEGIYVIDISNLPAGSYEIVFYATGQQPKAGTFEIPEEEE